MVDWLYVVGFAVFIILVHVIVWAVGTAGIRARARRDLRSGEFVLEYGWGARTLAILLASLPLMIMLGVTRFFLDTQAVQDGLRAWLVV